jgi:hypothetical protein
VKRIVRKLGTLCLPVAAELRGFAGAIPRTTGKRIVAAEAAGFDIGTGAGNLSSPGHPARFEHRTRTERTT